MKKRSGIFYVLLLLLAIVVTACAQQTNNATDKKSVKTEHKQTNNKKKKPKMTSKKTILSTLKNSNKKTITYDALGDSLSVGLFSNTKATRFTTQFANDLQKGTDKKVIENNTSLAGKTVTNFGLPMVQKVIDDNPDLVTIEFGTNDAAYGTDATNFGNFSRNLDTVVSKVKNGTHAQILLMTTWSPTGGQFEKNDVVYDQKIEEIGKKYNIPVVDLSTIWKGDPSVTKNDSGYSDVYSIQKDSFHPNQLGHDKIAKLLYQTVQK
ncbi:SGNH/GDSL hydrolase family protein [Companilactobacillus mishanensis]|uniref:SGNH/GDSL hydrolase family protein n=1 Tax=Companilactobacillus mishanensis TaxID=2486008 RepID=A0ABW9P9A3_9LACO|nr:SGNH/GDSL hydrolase family protein [Companilactobacillus mishanensis]MQS45805.1 SGNH/GDSL hydrolase family protein [Companilactobacillus mishanensis]